MNAGTFQKISNIAKAYAFTEFQFHHVRLVSLDEICSDKSPNYPRYLVILELNHTPEKIEMLAMQDNADEAEIKRAFLKDAFIAKLIVCGDAVESVEWPNMDIC